MEIWKNMNYERMDGELWKEIEGHSNYLVSNMGRVKSRDRFVNAPWKGEDKRYLSGKIMAQYKNRDGRLRVRIDGKYHSTSKLVGNAFIDKNGFIFENKNGNIKDNRVSNLKVKILSNTK